MPDITPNTVQATPWYASKTLWVNAIALIALLVQSITGHELLNVEIQASILAGINLVLRFITKQPISWS